MTFIIEDDGDALLDAISGGAVSMNEVRKLFFWGLTDSLSDEWYKWFEKHNSNSELCYNIVTERVNTLQNLYLEIERQMEENK